MEEFSYDGFEAMVSQICSFIKIGKKHYMLLGDVASTLRKSIHLQLFLFIREPIDGLSCNGRLEGEWTLYFI